MVFLTVMAFVIVEITVVEARDVTVWVGVGAVTVALTVPESTVDVLVVETVAVTKMVTELVMILVGRMIVVEISLVTSVMVVVSGPSGPSRRTRARRSAFSSRAPIFFPIDESGTGARGMHVAVSVTVVLTFVFVTVLCVCVAVEVVVDVTVVRGV